MKPPLSLAACCLNICEGRNQSLIESIANSAVSKQNSWSADYYDDHSNHIENKELQCKSSVISVYSDSVFNRGNITITGCVEYLSTAVFQACQVAVENISLQNHHRPNHPRLGVIDLIPIHPISTSVSLETCSGIAKNIGNKLKAVNEDLNVFYFGAADHLNRGLVQQRKENSWFDSSSTVEKTGSLGTTGIGATPYMSVLNVMLDTDDIELGQSIAQAVRGSSVNGLPGIQAMAFKKDKNMVEIACNVETNDLQSELAIFKTSFDVLEQHISQLASQYNISVIGQSLRGFHPHEAYNITHKALLNGNVSSWKERSQKMM